MYLKYLACQNHHFESRRTRMCFLRAVIAALLSSSDLRHPKRKGIIKVVGEVGTGKTMLCRMLPTKVPGDIDWVYLAHPNLSPDQTLQEVARELRPISATIRQVSGHEQLQAALLEGYANNRRVVVLVEEAQEMPLETLEELRLLSNLETDEHKLLQIVLFGQPELDEKLAARKIRQLRERINHSLYLPPLKLDDIHAYLNFRIRASGYTGPELFSRQVAKTIERYSHGLIRRINILADKALLTAYARDTYDLSVTDVEVAAHDSQYQPKKRRWPWSEAIASIALIALGALALSQGDPNISTKPSSRGRDTTLCRRLG